MYFNNIEFHANVSIIRWCGVGFGFGFFPFNSMRENILHLTKQQQQQKKDEEEAAANIKIQVLQ